MKYCDILGVRINVTDMKETVGYIEEHLEELRGHYICASNVHTTVTARRDGNYRSIQNHAAINLPDGKPLSVVQRRRGYEKAGRVPGPDLMPEIFRISLEKGYTHYFYGSTEKTLAALKKALTEKFPGLHIAGMYSPPFRAMTPEEDERATSEINACRPDFIWVGLGAPKQEKWMADHENRVCGVMLGVGAAFDFHAGTVKRAPLWMQESSMEWLFRMEQDPKRLIPRYLDTNFAFLYYLHKDRKAADRKSRKKAAGTGGRKRPLRIAMIGHKRIPSREGGVEVVVEELSRRLVELGCQVDAYNRVDVWGKRKEAVCKRRMHKGIRLINIPTPSMGSLNAIVYTVLATVRALSGGYDIIHYHAEGPCIMLWLPGLFGIKTVATVHGLDWQRAKWGRFASRMILRGEKTAAVKADKIIVLSKNVQDYFLRTYRRNTIFIPNGINRPVLRDACEIVKKYGLVKDGYILFVARIVPEKGLHYLIRAFGGLKTEKKLVIAGSSNSVQYMEKVRRMAVKDDRIIMTGHVEGRLLEELYSNACLFVLPSDVEGMSISLLEAMSYGNCCIVSDIEENREAAGEHAAIFRKGDVDSLRETVKMLLKDPEKRERLRKGSREFICGAYNWDTVAEQTMELYRELMR